MNNLLSVFSCSPGALTFDADIINNLQQHSSSEDTVTYAYYFTELFVPGKDILPVPEFLVSSANHGYDLPFVFGAPFMSDEGEPELWRGETIINIRLFNAH